MNTVTQKMKFRQSLIKYAEKYGVKKATIKYNVNRQYIYRWKKRYDGTLQSLADKSHRPFHHPNQHTEAEIKLIKDMRRRNPHAGLVVFWPLSGRRLDECRIQTGVDSGTGACMRILASEEDTIEVRCRMKEKLYAPVKEGCTVGEVEILLNGETVGTRRIVTRQKAEKISLPWCAGKVWKQFLGTC